MITGSISPNMEGGFGAKLSIQEEAEDHRLVTNAVYAVDPDIKICMQILHAGPLAGTPACVAPSAIPSRIARMVPNELDEEGVQKQLMTMCSAQKWLS
jgi:2,4-dienoyl-CoA reductase (NADPH2)